MGRSCRGIQCRQRGALSGRQGLQKLLSVQGCAGDGCADQHLQNENPCAGADHRCGEKYAFPVVLVGGPTDSTPENMCYTSLNINVASDKLTVRAFDYFQKEFDRFTVTPEGKIENEYNREDFKYYSY